MSIKHRHKYYLRERKSMYMYFKADVTLLLCKKVGRDKKSINLVKQKS